MKYRILTLFLYIGLACLGVLVVDLIIGPERVGAEMIGRTLVLGSVLGCTFFFVDTKKGRQKRSRQ